MSVSVNGTLIPQDKANALTVNGANITNVWANGVEVWKQQLFAAQWSGDSYRLHTSGSQFRYYASNKAYSAWGTVSLAGVIQAGDYRNPSTWGFVVSSNTIAAWLVTAGAGVVSFSIANGFTGISATPESTYPGVNRLETSGGLIRNRWSDTSGPWISLT